MVGVAASGDQAQISRLRSARRRVISAVPTRPAERVGSRPRRARPEGAGTHWVPVEVVAAAAAAAPERPDREVALAGPGKEVPVRPSSGWAWEHHRRRTR
jgi:hypothetical protein